MVTAAEAGLRVRSLSEHTATDVESWENATRETDGPQRARTGGEPVPLLFSLIAGKE